MPEVRADYVDLRQLSPAISKIGHDSGQVARRYVELASGSIKKAEHNDSSLAITPSAHS